MKTEQWSPEQIAGTLKIRHGKVIISHETIYQFIYSEEGKKEKLWLEMRHKRRPVRQSWGSMTVRDIEENGEKEIRIYYENVLLNVLKG